MRDEQPKKIREACIAANPDLKDRPFERFIHRKIDGVWCDDFIHLSDVLLAIGPDRLIKYDGDARSSTGNLVIDTQGTFLNENGMHLAHWYLRTDDLTQQSDETISFLADLLSA